MALNQLNLYGVIGEDVRAVDVKKALIAMDQTLPLIVKIDSEGGSVFDGFSIANALEAYAGPKKAIVEPSAFSIASYIVAVFDDVEIVENGYIMAHFPYTMMEGTSSELTSKAALLADMEEKMVSKYVQKTGQSEEEVRSMLAKETFLNAEQSVAMGLASSVSRVTKRPHAVASEIHLNMPTKVYAALFGSVPSGDNRETTKEKPMSSATPVAATVQEIKAAFPKAKAEFIVRCLEKGMPVASVAAAAAEELMAENDELMAKYKAMEEELMALKATAMTKEEPTAEETLIITESEDEEEMVAPMAKAHGAKPVARAAANGQPVSAKQRWDDLVAAEFANCKSRPKAVLACAKKHKDLHQQMLSEVNAR